MTREVSKSKMQRYRVMRLLFNCTGRDFDEIMREGELSKIELVNVMLYLKRNRLIKKETNEKGTVYILSDRGQVRLAFYEFTHQCYEIWRPKWCYGKTNGWEISYRQEMTDLIKKLNYFGYENVENVG